jgi:hypothetical protein
MIFRGLLLVIVVMLVLAAVTRLTRPRVASKRPAPRVQSARKCETCDAYVLGAAPEPCTRPDCPFR